MDSIETLTQLFHRRWAAPVLAELHVAQGAKFVTLTRRLDATPAAIRQTLDELIARGWVTPNPGYGHPLRPEYILTRAGQRLAPACARLTATLKRIDAWDVGLQKWSMPVLYVVGGTWWRFGELGARLGAVTDRALSLALQNLAAAELVCRRVEDDFPPRALYGATPAGRRLGSILSAL